MRRRAEGHVPSALDIQVDLEVKHPEGTASYRLIANWVKEFKARDEWQVLLDSPFRWHLMDRCSLPWEAGSFLVDLLFRLACWQENLRNAAERELERLRSLPEREQEELRDLARVPLLLPLTVREAIWCWRIHLAAPEIGDTVGDDDDVYGLARQFSSREIAVDVLGRPLDLADLEAILTFKPWLDEGRHRAYHTAVEKGAIPELVRDWVDFSPLIEHMSASDLRPGKEIHLRWVAPTWPEHSELLDSQQLDLAVNEVLLELGIDERKGEEGT